MLLDLRSLWEVTSAAFDAAFMAAMDKPQPDLIWPGPSVVASGMTPPEWSG